MGTIGLDRGRQRPLTVVGAATSAGAYGPGQERAPEYLRAHGLVDALVAQHRRTEPDRTHQKRRPT
jgi:arginase family enzyme